MDDFALSIAAAAARFIPHLSSLLFPSLLSPHSHPNPLSLSPIDSQVASTMAALPETKLFGKWSYEDVEVRTEHCRNVDLQNVD